MWQFLYNKIIENLYIYSDTLLVGDFTCTFDAELEGHNIRESVVVHGHSKLSSRQRFHFGPTTSLRTKVAHVDFELIICYYKPAIMKSYPSSYNVT